MSEQDLATNSGHQAKKGDARQDRGRPSASTAPNSAVENPELNQGTSHIGPDGAAMSFPATIQFDFKGNAVRTVSKIGETWFVAADVCAVLEHTDPSKAVSRLEADEKRTTIVRTLGGPQEVNVVTESGLYALIFSSRKAKAKVFRRWVTNVVLPSIRQTGAYRVNGAEQPPDTCRGLNVAIPGPGRFIITLLPGGIPKVHRTSDSKWPLRGMGFALA